MAVTSPLQPLFDKYDLRLVCDQCSVKEKEITYKYNPVHHECALHQLLCRAKGGSLWRPVSRRPKFPQPSRYQVCQFFREDSGCSEHKKHCSYARSVEEAAVWNFEMKLKLDHKDLCNSVAEKHGQDSPTSDQSLDVLALDLKTVCEKCCIQEKQITYSIKSVVHKCSKNVLLAKDKTSDHWRPIAPRPSNRRIGKSVQYQVCHFFIEGSGCTKHRKNCTFARSLEEATVWNYVRHKQMLVKDLVRQTDETYKLAYVILPNWPSLWKNRTHSHDEGITVKHVCFLEDEDHSKDKNISGNYITRLMVPISKLYEKICIFIKKKERHLLPVWSHICGCWEITDYKILDETFKQNHVFVVQVIEKEENHPFPLGKVIEVLPFGNSLSESLRILNKQYNVAPTTCTPVSLKDKNESLREKRTGTMTFTIDRQEANNLDDAISVDVHENQFELGIHIADVASYVTYGDELDMDAKKRCVTYYCDKSSDGPIHMFPEKLSTGQFSLLPKEDRSVVSLMFTVDKETNEIIGEPVLGLSTINSDHKLTYEEAEKKLNNMPEEPVDYCLKLAYEFSKARRKDRLKNWPYAQPDENRLPGERKAYLMIEELSVLFNSHVCKILTNSDLTRSFVPLRCQPEPKQENLDELKKRCAHLIPVSFSLWHKVKCEEQNPKCESFRVLQYIWKNIREAAEAGDNDRMVDLIAADDIHPQLMPIANQFWKYLSKAYFIRSMSSEQADVGHYSLNLKLYTQASSPIRRYIDLVLQRLLHCHVLQSQVPFSQSEIDTLCSEFDKNVAKEYERKAGMISCAVEAKKQSLCKVAFLVQADANSDHFLVTFPFKDIFEEGTSITYKHLQLDAQPEYDKTNGSVTLQWKRRVYAADKERLHKELGTTFHPDQCLDIPFKVWKSTVEAIKEENWDAARSLILSAETQASSTTVQTHTSEDQIEHEVKISLLLEPGNSLQVQLTCEVLRGHLNPTIQLVSITPKFELCVDHVQHPIKCFSQYVNNPPQIRYDNPEEYVHIWKPLCEMESAASAVRDSDNIVIENLEVNFCPKYGGKLKITGHFFLHSSWIEDWALRCDLAKCFLCIRKPGLPLKKNILQQCDILDYIKPGDPTEFTWVAHGITTYVEIKKKSPSGTLVHFNVNHFPMNSKHIPDGLSQKTSFTVELIPKTMPDIRKERAVESIPQACELVKCIALGHPIPKVSSEHSAKRDEYPDKLPPLNDSQFKAVNEALNNSLTLIQGPPGTGKTVVGVYIMLCFLKINKKNPRKQKKDKKEVILYCGPSNKSVDVIAEYMLKFEDSLKALRVYSEQVERLDYPYPECVLQFSSKTKAEQSNQSLRSITLHHRIREPTNPKSAKIKDFDQRIEKAIEDKEPFTADEVKQYRALLSEAREFELKIHDVILCTCTQSASPGLTKKVSARQILIDECAMATEPQVLVPLVCNNPEKIVLIGDHKQLRPIVKNDRVKKLGMSKSLFERYYTTTLTTSVMLNEQYRMHADICSFPSQEFYLGKLKTGAIQPNSLLRVGQNTMPVVFGDIEGVTVHQVVNTPKGNENSKMNHEEIQRVVKIARKLCEEGNIEQKSIVILSPYNAQVFEIKKALKDIKMNGINVSTITKSQGSEWRYVIISTVCSLPSEEIIYEPDGAWLSKHLGFVGDPNQINVAITRAKEGLCIIGNQKLLSCSRSWKKLLDYYKNHNAVTYADKISVFSTKNVK